LQHSGVNISEWVLHLKNAPNQILIVLPLYLVSQVKLAKVHFPCLASFLNGFSRLRAKLAPTREVGAYATVAFSWVGAYARSWRLRAKLAPSLLLKNRPGD
jgi:hypothetical protein